MAEQRDEAWVKSASPEDLVAAQQAGELSHYLGGLTADETAQAARVAGSRDRVQLAAYGLHGAARGDLDSTWFEAKRRQMSPAQLEKLAWVESSTPEAVYEAEQAGDLDHLLGLDVSKEAARLEAVAAQVRAAVGGV